MTTEEQETCGKKERKDLFSVLQKVPSDNQFQHQSCCSRTVASAATASTNASKLSRGGIATHSSKIMMAPLTPITTGTHGSSKGSNSPRSKKLRDVAALYSPTPHMKDETAFGGGDNDSAMSDSMNNSFMNGMDLDDSWWSEAGKNSPGLFKKSWISFPDPKKEDASSTSEDRSTYSGKQKRMSLGKKLETERSKPALDDGFSAATPNSSFQTSRKSVATRATATTAMESTSMTLPVGEEGKLSLLDDIATANKEVAPTPSHCGTEDTASSTKTKSRKGKQLAQSVSSLPSHLSRLSSGSIKLSQSISSGQSDKNDTTPRRVQRRGSAHVSASKEEDCKDSTRIPVSPVTSLGKSTRRLDFVPRKPHSDSVDLPLSPPGTTPPPGTGKHNHDSPDKSAESNARTGATSAESSSTIVSHHSKWHHRRSRRNSTDNGEHHYHHDYVRHNNGNRKSLDSALAAGNKAPSLSKGASNSEVLQFLEDAVQKWKDTGDTKSIASSTIGSKILTRPSRRRSMDDGIGHHMGFSSGEDRAGSLSPTKFAPEDGTSMLNRVKSYAVSSSDESSGIGTSRHRKKGHSTRGGRRNSIQNTHQHVVSSVVEGGERGRTRVPVRMSRRVSTGGADGLSLSPTQVKKMTRRGSTGNAAFVGPTLGRPKPITLTQLKKDIAAVQKEHRRSRSRSKPRRASMAGETGTKWLDDKPVNQKPEGLQLQDDVSRRPRSRSRSRSRGRTPISSHVVSHSAACRSEQPTSDLKTEANTRSGCNADAKDSSRYRHRATRERRASLDGALKGSMRAIRNMSPIKGMRNLFTMTGSSTVLPQGHDHKPAHATRRSSTGGAGGMRYVTEAVTANPVAVVSESSGADVADSQHMPFREISLTPSRHTHGQDQDASESDVSEVSDDALFQRIRAAGVSEEILHALDRAGLQISERR